MKQGFIKKNHKTIIDIAILVLIILFIFSYFQPKYLFSETTTTGGDTTSHYYYAYFLKENLIPKGRVVGWVMGNHGGFPVFQFYFPLPYVFMALLGYLIPLQITFKLGTILGTLLLPICTYFSFKAMRFKFPTPIIAAIFTLVFLFNEGNSMWGGNIPSTLAGEFSHSLGIALSILFLGLVYKHIDKKTGVVGNAIVLFLVGVSHFYTLVFTVAVPLCLLLTKKKFLERLKYLARVYGLGFLLLGFWIVPLITKIGYTTPFVDRWFITSIWKVLPGILIPFVILTIISIILIFFVKEIRNDDRLYYLLFGILAAFMFFLNAIALKVIDIRFVPFMQLFTVLVSAFLVSKILKKLKALWIVPIVVLFITLFWVKANVAFIHHWIPWNYEGYESKAPYNNFMAINNFVAGDLNDPRVAWEHNAAHNAFGSVRVFESIPYFSGRNTLEGLYMHASLNAPFIYYIQSEIGPQQSCPFPNFGCSNLDFEEAIPRLRQFNVKEIILVSDRAKQNIANNSNYQLLGTFQKYEVWELISDEYGYVTVSEYKPVLINTDLFQVMAYIWWVNDSLLDQPIVNDFNVKKSDLAYFNPATISHTNELADVQMQSIDNNCNIQESIEQEKIEFTTDCIGKPHLIKITYYPNWKVKGAEGVYQASPSFMLVIPNQSNVTIYYGKTLRDIIGLLFTALGVIIAVLLLLNNKMMKKFMELDFLNPIFRFVDKFKLILLVVLIALVLFGPLTEALPIMGASEEDALRTDIALATKKWWVCEHVGWLEDDCYIEVGKLTNDYNLCSLKFDGKGTDRCLKEIAVYNQDNNLCQQIKNSNIKDECLGST